VTRGSDQAVPFPWTSVPAETFLLYSRISVQLNRRLPVRQVASWLESRHQVTDVFLQEHICWSGRRSWDRRYGSGGSPSHGDAGRVGCSC